MTRKLLFLLFLAVLLGAQVIVGTIADITGDGSAHAISATSVKARWVKISAITGNGASVRIGDSNAGSGRGTEVKAGTTLDLPALPNMPLAYDLSKIYYYAANSDKLAVSYGQ